MQVRKYIPSDREQVENIHFETGLLGNSMSKLLSNSAQFKKSIRYYFEKEPQSIFVLEDNNKVVGYLLGCVDDRKNNDVSKALFQLPAIFIHSFFLPKKDRKYWFSQIKNIISIIIGKSGEIKIKHPKKAGHIHINLLSRYRGKGYGTQLLKEFEIYAKSLRVKTIHADGFQTSLNPNKNFWKKNGFKEFSKFRSFYWQDYFHDEEIYVVCYSKKI